MRWRQHRMVGLSQTEYGGFWDGASLVETSRQMLFETTTSTSLCFLSLRACLITAWRLPDQRWEVACTSSREYISNFTYVVLCGFHQLVCLRSRHAEDTAGVGPDPPDTFAKRPPVFH